MAASVFAYAQQRHSSASPSLIAVPDWFLCIGRPQVCAEIAKIGATLDNIGTQFLKPDANLSSLANSPSVSPNRPKSDESWSKSARLNIGPNLSQVLPNRSAMHEMFIDVLSFIHPNICLLSCWFNARGRSVLGRPEVQSEFSPENGARNVANPALSQQKAPVAWMIVRIHPCLSSGMSLPWRFVSIDAFRGEGATSKRRPTAPEMCGSAINLVKAQIWSSRPKFVRSRPRCWVRSGGQRCCCEVAMQPTLSNPGIMQILKRYVPTTHSVARTSARQIP